MCNEVSAQKTMVVVICHRLVCDTRAIELWHDDDDDDCDDDELIEWYEGYQKRKAQKAQIKEELMPIAWHPDRVMDWCMSKDEKEGWK